jgi:hypothetical protein
MWMDQFDFGKALSMTTFLLSLAFLFGITLSPSP